MIKNIRHKGLRVFYEEGDGAKLPPQHLSKINRILTALDAIAAEEDIWAMGNGIHRLKGNFEGFWALSVTPNYRIIFRFVSPDVLDVDYLDYH